MTKVEALIKLMSNNGGLATWQYIYDNIAKYYPNIQKSTEWQAGLRGTLYREIRNNTNFKKVGLGLFGLMEYNVQKEEEEIKKDTIRMHSYIQGVMIEMGNYDKHDTYSPDISATFQKNIKIGDITSIKVVPKFTYSEIVEITKRIDIIYFNNTKGYQFPLIAVEVVDSIGTLDSSLSRLYQLKHFKVKFIVITPQHHLNKIERALQREPYSLERDRFIIQDYDTVLRSYKARIEAESLRLF